MNRESKTPTVFVTYVEADQHQARRVIDMLRSHTAANVFDGFGSRFDDSEFVGKVLSRVSSRDYILFLLSPASLDDRWINRDIQLADSEELAYRKIELVPVIVEPCQVPPQLENWRSIDLTRDFDGGADELVSRVMQTYRLDLAQLSPTALESLVADLLRAWGVTVEDHPVRAHDRGFDFKASALNLGLFGRTATDTWLVNVKKYKGVLPLSEVRAFASAVQDYNGYARGLLVTTGSVTSISREYLHDLRDNRRVEIQVVEGTELKRLISAQQALVEIYFS